jgi:NADH-quinone oxidoreductase subunit E
MEKLEAQLADILTPERKDSRHLIFLLQQVQSKAGYVSTEAMLEIAEFLEVPAAAVYGVATFYNQFRFIPPGKHSVKICLGTACHLAGGKIVLEAMARELKVDVGGVTEYHEFSLDRVACIGCCALAPVAVIDGTVYPGMNARKVEEVLVKHNPSGLPCIMAKLRIFSLAQPVAAVPPVPWLWLKPLRMNWQDRTP